MVLRFEGFFGSLVTMQERVATCYRILLGFCENVMGFRLLM